MLLISWYLISWYLIQIQFNTCPFIFLSETCELLPCVFLHLLQALDNFNTTIVSPIYYAMFTSFTIFASAIMFKVLLPKHHMMIACHSTPFFCTFCNLLYYTHRLQRHSCILWCMKKCKKFVKNRVPFHCHLA